MRFHGIEIAERIKNEIIRVHKDAMGLKLVDVGSLEMLPHPEEWSDVLPAVIVEPREMLLNFDESGDLSSLDLPLVVHYVYEAKPGERPTKVAGENAEAIATTLQEFEKLGNPELENVRIKHCEVTGLNYSTDFTREFWMRNLFFAGMEISFNVAGTLILD